MRLIHLLCTWLLILIGTIHIFFGFITFQSFNAAMLWFVGSGLAMIFIGLLNLMFRLRHDSLMAYRLDQTGNFLLLTFIIAFNSINLMLPGIIGLIIMLLLPISVYKIHKD